MIILKNKYLKNLSQNFIFFTICFFLSNEGNIWVSKAWPQSLPTQDIDLLQAMVLAEQHSYAHKAAVSAWQSLELEQSAAQRTFGPQINASGSTEWQKNISDVNGAAVDFIEDDDNSGKEGWAAIVDVELRQPLTGFITSYHNYQRSMYQAQVARYQGLSEKDQAALLGAQNFLNHLLAETNLTIQKANLAAAAKSRDDAKAMYETGSLFKDDYLQLVLQYTQAKQLVVEAQSQVRVARFILAQSLGFQTPDVLRTIHPELSLWESWNPQLPSLNEALEKVSSQNPSLQANRMDVLAAQAERLVVQDSFLPEIDAFALYRWDWSREIGDATTSRTNDVVAGITLEWAIWDWGVRSAQLGAATERVYESRYLALQNVEAVKNGLVTQYYAIQDDIAAIQAAKEAVTAAQEAYELVSFRFVSGQVSALDVTTALKNFTQAQAALAQSRFDLDLAWVSFLVYLGERPRKGS